MVRTVSFVPWTTLRTPSGLRTNWGSEHHGRPNSAKEVGDLGRTHSPASFARAARIIEAPGSSSEGLRMYVLPQVIATGNIQSCAHRGHGLGTGRRCNRRSCVSVSCGPVRNTGSELVSQHRDHCGEIEWCNASADAEGLSNHYRVHIGAHLVR
eukprot:SAG11_NODE_1575_length_4659_cov_2.048904_4_plen_154_part_00